MASRFAAGSAARVSPQKSSDQVEDTLIRWLLILPFIGLMIVPLYNVQEPYLFGFPFFYWYQLAWVPVTSLLTYLVFRSVRHDG